VRRDNPAATDISLTEPPCTSLGDVIEVRIHLTNPADFASLNEEYARWFPYEPPTRYVAKLGIELSGLLVSILVVIDSFQLVPYSRCRR
jgi:enamine deaminase RidA (YjgF/YER057c/UK114 family)